MKNSFKIEGKIIISFFGKKTAGIGSGLLNWWNEDRCSIYASKY
jgi:hypothetical protein